MVEMHSSGISRNAAPSAVSSSLRLAEEVGSASHRTWFAKGSPDSANGLSVFISPVESSMCGLSSFCVGRNRKCFVWLTRTAEVATFQRREREEKESGLMFGLDGGGGGHHGTTAWLRTII